MAFKQDRNDELMDALRAEVQFRYEPQFAWKSACSSILALPGLVAFWPMSAVRRDSAVDQARDLAGGGYHLTNNNTALFGYDNLAPYVEFDGVNQYLSRADGGAADWADILGTETHIVAAQRGLTLSGWFYPKEAIGSNEYLVAKYIAAANGSFFLRRDAAGLLNGYVTSGAANTAVSSVGTAMTSDVWHFAALVFEPSNALKINLDGVWFENVAAIPAALDDSTADFVCGATSSAIFPFEGRESMISLAASASSEAIVGQVFQQSRAMFGV